MSKAKSPYRNNGQRLIGWGFDHRLSVNLEALAEEDSQTTSSGHDLSSPKVAD